MPQPTLADLQAGRVSPEAFLASRNHYRSEPMTYRDAQMAAQADFHAHEMATDTASDRAYDRFLAKVEKLTGIENLDGNNTAAAQALGTADGYSLDECVEWFEAGWTPERAAAQIAANRRDLVAL